MKFLGRANSTLPHRSLCMTSVVRASASNRPETISTTAADSILQAPATLTRRGAMLSACILPFVATSSTCPALAFADRPVLAEGSRVFMEIKVDTKVLGRIVIELFPDVKVGAQRFLELCKGFEGVAYRSSKFEEISAGEFIACSGVRNLSYSANGETKITGGDSATEQLVPELALGLHKHDAPGLVSLFVKEEAEREVKERLIARDGKLVTVTEETGAAPNGTAFAITLQADPEFDATNLVVGRVVEGLEIVEQVSRLKAVKDNTDSPYFQVAKAIGDKRADVAERGFGRPFARVIVSKAGVLA